MGRLIYSMITSLDGFVADTDGRFDWSAPDQEVHAAVNDLMRPIGTHLYGRRLYEVMAAWETMDLADEPAVMVDFARLWRAADKVVVSTTLASVSTARTRLVRSFDPVAVATLVRDSADDVLVGGPGLLGTAGAARPVSRPLHCTPAWSTRSTCSSRRSSSVAARPLCPPGCGSRWPCADAGPSATGSCT